MDRIRWIDLRSHSDERGRLTVVESAMDIPFDIKRVFYVHDAVEDRGGHAHRDTEQLLVAVHGSLTVRAFNGHVTQDFTLDNPRRGLYVPPMIFCDLRDFSPGAVCLSLASTHYDVMASIRTLDSFESEVAQAEAADEH